MHKICIIGHHTCQANYTVYIVIISQTPVLKGSVQSKSWTQDTQIDLLERLSLTPEKTVFGQKKFRLKIDFERELTCNLVWKFLGQVYLYYCTLGTLTETATIAMTGCKKYEMKALFCCGYPDYMANHLAAYPNL